MNRIAIVLVCLAGCSSIVDDPCAAGFHLTAGRCIASDGPDAGTGGPGGNDPDANPGGGGDDGGNGVTCAPPELLCDGACIDVSSDPLNCGACNHACASGICDMGQCVGEVPGHIVAIGHDYQSYNPAMARVLGNAVSLGVHHDVGLARLQGNTQTAALAAIGQSMGFIGRPWHMVTPSADTLDDVDVLLVEARVGEAQTAHAGGVTWAPAIAALLARGGVVIVLEGAGGVTYQFADGAGLYSWSAPVDATATPAFVSDASDAIVQHVVSPYFADTTSVVFPGVTGVITTPDGAVVVHQTR